MRVKVICKACQKEFSVIASRAAKYNVSFCSRSCQRTVHPCLSERFWPKVNKMDTCWLWTGAKTGGNRGYGAIADDYPSRKMLQAHRVSYTLNIGPIPEGMFVCHTCDNRYCVNPDHLFLGTHQDNMQDMHNKGRHASGDRQGARLHPETLRRGENHPLRINPQLAARGERNGWAKLTEETARQIRHLYEIENLPIYEIVQRLGIPRSRVKGVTQRKTWTHI